MTRTMRGFPPLSKAGHELRRQAREQGKLSGKKTGKRKAKEQEVRAIPNELGATVGDRFGRTAAADERNGYRDDLNASAPANPGPAAKAAKPALDWSQHLKVTNLF